MCGDSFDTITNIGFSFRPMSATRPINGRANPSKSASVGGMSLMPCSSKALTRIGTFISEKSVTLVASLPSIKADLATGPEVLAVGYLHIENFGTWRDAEGRLVWGINDFDEACRMPYAIDLVRLAASAVIAAR